MRILFLLFYPTFYIYGSHHIPNINHNVIKSMNNNKKKMLSIVKVPTVINLYNTELNKGVSVK